MLKAFLEPNIINWVRRKKWSVAELRTRLAVRDLMPQVGIHGIYELARGLLSDEDKADAQSNFRILSELDPVLVPTPQMLFLKELDLLRTGATVIAVLDERNCASAKHEIREMAAGRIEVRGTEFISRRQSSISRDRPRFISRQLGQIEADIASGAKRPKTFEQAFAMLDWAVPTIISQSLRGRVTASEAVAIHARLDSFPAIRSTVRANLYLWAVPWMNNVGASRDKTDDLRHVIEASYSDVFVTGDRQLANTVPSIHPNLRVLTWRELHGR